MDMFLDMFHEFIGLTVWTEINTHTDLKDEYHFMFSEQKMLVVSIFLTNLHTWDPNPLRTLGVKIVVLSFTGKNCR